MMFGKHKREVLLSLMALAGVLAFELEYGPFLVPPATSGAASEPKQTILALGEAAPEAPGIGSFAEVAARPLFNQDRRPAPPETPAEKVAKVEENVLFDLVGVVISDRNRVALLRPRSEGKIVFAMEGKSFGGWEVSAINSTEVILKRGAERSILKLSDLREEAALKGRATLKPGGKPQEAKRKFPNYDDPNDY
jgi:hypothetical protein